MDLGWIDQLGQLDFWKELLAGFEGLGYSPLQGFDG